jgi:uncharacterized damage-inducible protein DinB
MNEYFKKIFLYNKWRHQIIYDKFCTVEVFKKNLDINSSNLYFETIKGTLNHLLLADILWYMRIIGEDDIKIRNLPTDKTYNYRNISQLWVDKENKFKNFFDDRNWLENHKYNQFKIFEKYELILESLKPEEYNKNITYLDTAGTKTHKILSDCLFHIVNHHTHHIGQISSEFSKLSKNDVPSTDYTIFH